MIQRRGNRYAALAFALFTLACGDSATAPNDESETVRVALGGLDAGAAGVVLRLTGPVERIEPAVAALEVAWVAEGTSSATVVIVGPLSENADVVLVRRPAGSSALGAEVQEVASGDGTVSSTTTVRAMIR